MEQSAWSAPPLNRAPRGAHSRGVALTQIMLVVNVWPATKTVEVDVEEVVCVEVDDVVNVDDVILQSWKGPLKFN